MSVRSDGGEGAGVQALIERLHAEGVEAGRAEAARIVDEAREEAARRREQARVEAQMLAQRTRAELQVEREAAIAAVRLAYRDALVALNRSSVRFVGTSGPQSRVFPRDSPFRVDSLARKRSH